MTFYCNICIYLLVDLQIRHSNNKLLLIMLE